MVNKMRSAIGGLALALGVSLGLAQPVITKLDVGPSPRFVGGTRVMLGATNLQSDVTYWVEGTDSLGITNGWFKIGSDYASQESPTNYVEKTFDWRSTDKLKNRGFYRINGTNYNFQVPLE